MDQLAGAGNLPNASNSSHVVQTFERLRQKTPEVAVRSFKPIYDDSGRHICQFDDRSKQRSYHDVIVGEGNKIVRGGLKKGDQRNRCYLFRLPLDVRMRIYAELFKHDGSAIEIGRLSRTGVADLSILRVCHAIYHEAVIALYHSLSYRKLFLRTYGVFSADLLTRFPRPLPSCGNRQLKGIRPPCRNHKLGWYRPLGSVLLLLGSEDLKIALQRQWSFTQFTDALKRNGPVPVYNLSIVVNHNWKSAQFDERHLVKALFSGAFEILGKVNLRCFTEEERNCLCRQIYRLGLPHLKIEKEKKKIQGKGFSLWIW
ncbi:hypothetical protein BJX61DRAFT_546719 [Aspergillus egyptiacus]|nr:hypothetical protein BJX61DRAFT_546719 [Aspergillus egyptiacus]